MKFQVAVSGEIESVSFVDSVTRCSCYFQITFSQNAAWGQTSGELTGRSPVCNNSSNDFVWNVPIFCTMTSTTPAGWPRIVLRVTVADWRGREVVYGYGLLQVPTLPGRHTRRVPLVAPSSSSWWALISGWILGSRPAIADPSEFFSDNNKSQAVTMRPTGAEATVNLTVAIKDSDKLNFKFC